MLPSFLKTLVTLQIFERLSFYGINCLLILFFTQELGFADIKAYPIYAIYGSLGFTIPLISGILSDKIFGYRKLILAGLISIVAGNILILISYFHRNLLFFGLGFIALGVGFFKNNLNNLLGSFYEDKPKEKNYGFALSHMAVNFGAFSTITVCGFIGQTYGWYYAFCLAFLASVTALCLFIKHEFEFGEHGLEPYPDLFGKNSYTMFYLFTGMVVAGISLALFLQNCATISRFWLMFIVALLTLGFGYVIYSSNERKRVLAGGCILLAMVSFFAIQMQMGSFVNLFIRRCVNTSVFGFQQVPSSAWGSIDPVAILLFGLMLGKKYINERYQTIKFWFALLGINLAFLFLYLGCLNPDMNNQVHYLYYVLAAITLALCELFVASFVNSQVNSLAPDNQKGFMMGLVMVACALSGSLSSEFGKLFPVDHIKGVVDPVVALQIYKSAFGHIVFWNFIIVICMIPLLLFVRSVTKEMHEERDIKTVE